MCVCLRVVWRLSGLSVSGSVCLSGSEAVGLSGLRVCVSVSCLATDRLSVCLGLCVWLGVSVRVCSSVCVVFVAVGL